MSAGPRAAPAGIRDTAEYSRDLEALRGVAILLVVLFHADGIISGGHRALIGSKVSPLSAFVTAGHTGVTLFFVLSAFLLSRAFLVEANGGPRVNRVRFYERRAMRILPLYFVFVATAAVATSDAPAQWLRGLPYLFFANSIYGVATPLLPWSAVWWSLATEAQFYAVLPIVGSALGTPLGRRALVLAVPGYVLIYRALCTGELHLANGAAQVTLLNSLVGRAPAFAFGMAAAWFVQTYGVRVRAACVLRPWTSWAGDVALLAVAAALGFLLSQVVSRHVAEATLHWHAWHVAEAICWTAVVLLIQLVPGRLRLLICNRALSWIGLLSYSLYLVHLPVLYRILLPLHRSAPGGVGTWSLHVWTRVGFALVLCTAISAATYVCIERPFLVRKAKLST